MKLTATICKYLTLRRNLNQVVELEKLEHSGNRTQLLMEKCEDVQKKALDLLTNLTPEKVWSFKDLKLQYQDCVKKNTNL